MVVWLYYDRKVLTYIMRGYVSVVYFRERQLIQFVEGLECRRFYVGLGMPNPAVNEWLNDLKGEVDQEPWISPMNELLHWILSLEPRLCPSCE